MMSIENRESKGGFITLTNKGSYIDDAYHIGLARLDSNLSILSVL